MLPQWDHSLEARAGGFDMQASRRALVFALLALPGCAAEGPRYQPAALTPLEGQGVIYVYRPLSAIGKRGESPFVRVNGVSYGAMKPGSFIAANVPEGDIKVSLQQSVFMMVPTFARTVEVTVVPGSISYVRVNQTIDSMGSGGAAGGLQVMQSIQIEEVPFDVGQKELEETRQNN
jgi:Protein of unknown function (DUF2846)